MRPDRLLLCSARSHPLPIISKLQFLDMPVAVIGTCTCCVQHMHLFIYLELPAQCCVTHHCQPEAFLLALQLTRKALLHSRRQPELKGHTAVADMSQHAAADCALALPH